MASACLPIICSATCDTQLPPVDFDICNPQVKFGQISTIYITNIGNPLTDETDGTEWYTRLNLLAANPAKIIALDVIGSKPVAEATIIDISKNRKVQGNKNHTVNIKIDDLSQANYEMMRAFECGKTLLVWYETLEGELFGGAAGIEASILLNHMIPESANDLQDIEGTLTWRSKFHPCRTTMPEIVAP
jgi:hypothetical protein